MSSMDVVIPCYGYGSFLSECVHSVLGQGFPDVRVLIIDDASPDETPQVAKDLAQQDARVSYVRHARNRGHIATYNEGIEWTEADYMLLLSADDYLLPGAFQRAVACLDANPRAGLCFGRALALQDDGTFRGLGVDEIADRGREYTLLRGADFIRLSARAGSRNIVPTPTAVVRTNLIKRLGGYLPELPHSGDMEMWLRLASYSNVAIVNAEQAVYRQHARNMSHSYLLDGGLSDLRHRKAAIDALRTCTDTNSGDGGQHRVLLSGLARDAVGNASAAFNNNQTELSRELRDFALEAHPRIKYHPASFALSLKRLVGHRIATSVVVPTAARIKGATSRTRQHSGSQAIQIMNASDGSSQ